MAHEFVMHSQEFTTQRDLGLVAWAEGRIVSEAEVERQRKKSIARKSTGRKKSTAPTKRLGHQCGESGTGQIVRIVRPMETTERSSRISTTCSLRAILPYEGLSRGF
jgi:hypothetical protein